MAFYQSPVRKEIQEKIYKKPTFTINLFNKEYFGTIKTKKIGPTTLRRYQVLDVQLPTDKTLVYNELQKIKKHYGKSSDLFFQLGITNEIISFDNKDLVCEEFKQELRHIRKGIRSHIQKDYNLHHAWRENMPEAGLEYFLDKSDEEYLADMDSGCKQRVKKAIKQNIGFSICEAKDYKKFYEKRSATAGSKGFNIIPYNQFQKLIEVLTEEKKGNLFVATLDDEIIAGSICVFDNDRIIYLYGFHDKAYNTIGSHHFLKFKIFGRGRDNGFRIGDMIGGSPTGFPEHPLHSVTCFKESMGGIKKEYYGNYDIVLNPFAYKLMKTYYQRKHH